MDIGYTAAVVGNADADKSGVQTVFGDGLTANLAAFDSLSGLSSWTTADGSVIGTTASLLGGTFGDTAGTVSMAWRTRTADEAGITAAVLLADVVDLHTGTGSNPFVLQMSYDPAQLNLSGGLTEQLVAQQGSIYLGWLNASDQWVNAINGNFSTNGGVQNFQGSWSAAGSPMDLGAWGVNAADHTVWAVVNHNSQFSVVPEPATITILCIGSLVLLRRKK